MKFIPKNKNKSSLINLTPLIDCMFLLVIFILIIARFENDGNIPVDLPKSETSSSATPKTTLMNLTITSDGLFFFDGEPISLSQLRDKIISARTAAGDPTGENTILVIYGDKQALHGVIVEALDIAKQANQSKVSIKTKQ